MVRSFGRFHSLAEKLGGAACELLKAARQLSKGNSEMRRVRPFGRRDVQHGREMPIILLTGLQGPNVIAKGREAGATSTMSKLFGPEHIISVVKRILGRRSDLAGA
jgi:CheY-like chemotaxis protein